MTTPAWLRLGMIVTLLPVAGFAVAIHVGLTRNADTVQTVGEDATRGITAAQALKLNLAELDSVAVEHLVSPTTLVEGGYPEPYNTKRIELQQNIIAAATESPGPAYGQSLASIDYALGHYHSLLGDAFAIAATGDLIAADEQYDRAHAVMVTTLFPEADRFDQAHTSVLNESYRRQKDRTLGTFGWIVGSWAVLVAVLVAVQLAFARRFRRILSIPLAVASLLAVAGLAGAVAALNRSEDKLADARDQAFDSIHKLARARSTAAAAQQAQGDFLLDPGDALAKVAFDDYSDQLFNNDSDSDDSDDGEGGYLGSVVNADVASASRAEAETAIDEFGQFLQVDENMRRMHGEGDRPGAVAAVFDAGSAYDDLDGAIATAQGTAQDVFDRHTDSAKSATRVLPWLNLTLAGAIGVLVVAGFWFRLREYR